MLNKIGSFISACVLLSGALYGQAKSEFSTFVTTGDSLTAGYQNPQLLSTSQVHGYANVIATQAGVSLNLPLILAPGYPQISLEDGFSVATGITPQPRTNNNQTYDVAVPGYAVADFVGHQASCPPDYTNPIYVMAQEILNPTCPPNSGPTELQVAAGLKPTTATMWIGNNDVLFTILYGDPSTSLFSFATSYNQAINTLARASGHLVVANIPDVTVVAYLTSVPELAAILNLPIPIVEKVFGLQPGDDVTPYAFAAIQAMGTNLTTLPETGPQGPIVVRAATLRQIQLTVLAYNAIIEVEAAINGATVVDIYSFVNNLAANGAVVDGKKLTLAFGGGFFSLDGIHPTNTGYALIANEFIKTMNRSLGSNIPQVSVDTVAKTDPLFPQSVSGGHGTHVPVTMATGLRALLNH
jgi:lysophospholipase L1-like esterase